MSRFVRGLGAAITVGLVLGAAGALGGCASTRQNAAVRPPAPLPASTATRSAADSPVVARAEEALAGAPADQWRPALRAELERHLEKSGGASARVGSLLNDSTSLTRVGAAGRADVVDAAVLVGPEMRARSGRRVMVVCRGGEFDVLESSIVVCLGDLRARSVRNCLLFVTGRVEADQIDSATICGERLEARSRRDTEVYAAGGRTTR